MFYLNMLQNLKSACWTMVFHISMILSDARGLSFANGVIMLKTLGSERLQVLERSSFDEALSHVENVLSFC